MTSLFSKRGVLFPEIPEDGLVEVVPYLEAARHIPMIFDSLGTAFKPLKGDVTGNITKIQKQYDKDPAKYAKFKSLLEEEVLQKKTSDSNSASVALLWLNRGLEYIMIFLRNLVDDHKAGKKTENMVPFVQKGYEQSLKPYHGWVIQKVFSVVSHATPWRKDFLKTLADGSTSENYEDEVIEDIDLSLRSIEPNVKAIYELLDELGLNKKDKV